MEKTLEPQMNEKMYWIRVGIVLNLLPSQVIHAGASFHTLFPPATCEQRDQSQAGRRNLSVAW